MRKAIHLFILSLTFMSFSSPSLGQSLIDLSAKVATVYISDGVGLTEQSPEALLDVISGFLESEGLSATTSASLSIISESKNATTGFTHVRLRQQIDGLFIYGTYVKATFNSNNKLIHVIELLADASAVVTRASISAGDALQAALNHNFPTYDGSPSQAGVDGNKTVFSNNGFFYQNPSATKVIAPLTGGTLQEAYLVIIWSSADNLLYHTLVGNELQILDNVLRTNTDSYNIFPDHPGNSEQTITPGPGAESAESPMGWLSGDQTTINIRGNNVHAYLDTDADDLPDPGGSEADTDFLATANLSKQPNIVINKAAAVQNLFYYNNVLHDKLYQHGFTESAGNFQEDNFEKGGLGGDSVKAEAQDGRGYNNANFATPVDGFHPRMQMFLWTFSSPKRDGDLDSDIIYHEYGHGLTWRMIGEMIGPMSRAIGEGMSDGLAILFNGGNLGGDVIAEYSSNKPTGIRRNAYTNYSLTYGDMTGKSVHSDGEIYAAIVWKLRELFDEDIEILWNYIIGGMNFTPSQPSFEDMRDGMLAASQSLDHDCKIWKAFALFGVGEGASGSVRSKGFLVEEKLDILNIKESTTEPAECSDRDR